MAEISASMQASLSKIALNQQLLQGTFETSSKITELSQNINTNFVYAAKGDSKYDENSDSNNDGIVTYNEYVRYVQEQSLPNMPKLKDDTKMNTTINTESGVQKVTFLSIKKALNNYLTNSGIKMPTPMINVET